MTVPSVSRAKTAARSGDTGDAGRHFQVAVVGFGPTGAVGAGLLGQRGIRTLVVDRAVEVYDKPRAIALDHEILRMFDNMGVADRVLPHIAPFPTSVHYGAAGQVIRRIDMVPPPYPLGYTPTMVFSQPPVEAALRAHVAAGSSVEVALGTELVGFQASDHRVQVELRDGGGGRCSVTADYLIACDGASSSVRQALGIELEDLAFDEPWLVVDVLMHEHAIEKLPGTAAQFCDPARPATFIIGPGLHRRWEIMLLPGEDPQSMARPDAVWQLLSRWIDPEDGALWRAASYRFHALVAREWRRGRVFLAGDAAHQQPPFIGQGMCQGLRDISNLVWKLDRVIKGEAKESLLDTYGEERSAHVRELTQRIKAIGRVICERDPDVARVRDERLLAEGGGVPRTITRQEIVPPLRTGLIQAGGHPAAGTLFPQPRVRGNGREGLLDAVCGTDWRLVLDGRETLGLGANTRSRLAAIGMRVIRIWPEGSPPTENGTGDLDVIERDGVMARWFEAQGCRATIVRPDHYVFAAVKDEAELVTALSELEKRLTGRAPTYPDAGPPHPLP